MLVCEETFLLVLAAPLPWGQNVAVSLDYKLHLIVLNRILRYYDIQHPY